MSRWWWFEAFWDFLKGLVGQLLLMMAQAALMGLVLGAMGFAAWSTFRLLAGVARCFP